MREDPSEGHELLRERKKRQTDTERKKRRDGKQVNFSARLWSMIIVNWNEECLANLGVFVRVYMSKSIYAGPSYLFELVYVCVCRKQEEEEHVFWSRTVT